MIIQSKSINRLGIYFLVLLSFTFTPKVLSAEEKAVLSKTEVLDGAADHFRDLIQAGQCFCEYRMETVRMSYPGVAKNEIDSFAWPWMEVVNASKGNQLYARWMCPSTVAILQDPQSQLMTETIVAWNGTIGLSIEIDKNEKQSAISPGKCIVYAKRPNLFCYRNFYLKHLSYAVCIEEGQTEREKMPEGIFWLPEALKFNRDQWIMKPDLDEVDGQPCYVLERAGWDTLWIDAEHGFALRRRIFSWRPSKSRRVVLTNSQLRQVSDRLWLPTKTIYEQYTAPWNRKELWDKVAWRQTIDVKTIRVSEVEEALFERLRVPDNCDCFDERTNSHFTNFAKDADPLEDTLESAIRKTPQADASRSLWFWINLLLIGVLIATIVFHLVRSRSKLGDRL